MCATLTEPCIGIFDSGIGGISVLQALQKKAPHLRILYLADTAHFPYGEKSVEQIQHYSEQICHFLIHQGATHILCGCNTASSADFHLLQKKIPVPLFGIIEPAVQLIASLPLSRIGIVATETATRLGRHKALLQERCPNLRVWSQACPKLAPLVEEGLKQKRDVRSSVKEYLSPLLQENIEALLIGCTHYSFLHDEFRALLPQSCMTIDPAEACVEALFQYEPRLVLPSSSQHPVSFFTTSTPTMFCSSIQKLLRWSIEKNTTKIQEPGMNGIYGTRIV